MRKHRLLTLWPSRETKRNYMSCIIHKNEPLILTFALSSMHIHHSAQEAATSELDGQVMLAGPKPRQRGFTHSTSAAGELDSQGPSLV
jgi:hypothetical protein